MIGATEVGRSLVTANIIRDFMSLNSLLTADAAAAGEVVFLSRA